MSMNKQPDIRIHRQVAQALEHAVAVVVGERNSDGPVTRTNPGGPPLNEQSGRPSASALAKKEVDRAFDQSPIVVLKAVRASFCSSRSEMRRLSNWSWSLRLPS
jgi:hypothetical protein